LPLLEELQTALENPMVVKTSNEVLVLLYRMNAILYEFLLLRLGFSCHGSRARALYLQDLLNSVVSLLCFFIHCKGKLTTIITQKKIMALHNHAPKFPKPTVREMIVGYREFRLQLRSK